MQQDEGHERQKARGKRQKAKVRFVPFAFCLLPLAFCLSASYRARNVMVLDSPCPPSGGRISPFRVTTNAAALSTVSCTERSPLTVRRPARRNTVNHSGRPSVDTWIVQRSVACNSTTTPAALPVTLVLASALEGSSAGGESSAGDI